MQLRDKRAGAEQEEINLPGQTGSNNQICDSASQQGAQGCGLCWERDGPDPGMPRHGGQGRRGAVEDPGKGVGAGGAGWRERAGETGSREQPHV